MTNAPPSAPDVRMHGFSRRSEVPVVLEWIDRNALRLPFESDHIVLHRYAAGHSAGSSHERASWRMNSCQ